MTILTAKLLISILFLSLTLVAVYTMFEAFGRTEKKFNIEKLKKIHRINGIAFFILVLILGGLGMAYIALTRGELSPRAAFHVMLAHGVGFLVLFKFAIIRTYRQFYPKAPTVGILIAFFALGTVASSAGYYVLSGRFLSTISPRPATTGEEWKQAQAPSTLKGKEFFFSRCAGCHGTGSDSTSGVPGMKGILKRATLPSTGRPATPGNIVVQLKTPYKRMPAFPDLTDEETAHIIAYMKTL